jgi:hypothetical protein
MRAAWLLVVITFGFVRVFVWPSVSKALSVAVKISELLMNPKAIIRLLLSG